jgi:hypothetical protein
MDRDLQVTTTGTAGPAAPPGPDASVGWEEWPPPPTPSGRSVPLTDLLTIADLTPSQAMLVAIDLFQGLAAPGPERVHAVLRADGAVDVAAVDRGFPGLSVPELLDEVVRSARRLRAHPQPEQLQLLRHLEEQVTATGDPAERATALRAALAQTSGAGTVVRIRRELAALVKAFNGIAVSSAAPGVPLDEEAVAPAPVARPEHPRARPRAARQTSRQRARTRRMLIVLVVLALALVAGGYVFVRGPGSHLLDSLRGRDSHPTSRSHPAPSPTTHHQAGDTSVRHGGTFPALAAHAAGRVRGVAVQQTGGCRPRSVCGVTVTVRLAATGASQAVGWRVGVVRRCGHQVLWSPKTTITAQPGWSRVFASSSVRIPTGRSLALVALTTTPDHAQSRPVPVAGTARHC